MPGCELSIVIPVHDDQASLERITNELLENQPTPAWEVIVVDDGSPRPLKLSSKCPDNWKMTRLDQQSGAAVARNTGVKQARGTHIALLSVFLKVPKDYVQRISGFISSAEFDVAVHLLESAPELTLDPFQRFLGSQKERLDPTSTQISIKNTLFTAAIIKKEPFCKLKGFDESMQHYGGHEMDFAHRLDQAGYTKRIIIPDFPLQRLKIESHIRIRQRLQEYGTVGLPALLHKHPELKLDILAHPLLWRVLSILGITRFMEKRISRKIETDRKLAHQIYRLYLHLIVRNAWDAR